MTIYTDGLIVRRDRNLLDDVASSQFEAAEAAFDQAFFENPTTAARRINELNRAEQGDVISPAYPAYGIEEVRAEPATPLLTAEQARARVKESGLDLTIDDAGIREGALDILLERKREEVQRQFVLDHAPGSTVPLQLLAGFVASVLDPINVASAFVPVVGEARYASMLAKATTRAGRFGVRARVGAIEGAVGAALVEPLVLYASERDQADYDITDSMLNIAFGTVLGGGLHATGGAISDFRRGSVLQDVQAEAPTAIAAPTAKPKPLPDVLARIDDDPMAGLRESLQRGIEADRQRIALDAEREAFDELLPEIRAELEAVAAGKLPNVRDLKAEHTAVTSRLDTLDDTFRERAKAAQDEGMTRKQAERSARDAIAEERQQLTERKAEVEELLAGNRQAELAREELARLGRGEIPEQFKERIAERAATKAEGFEIRDTARARVERAPWFVRESALRTAVAQAVSGRPVDVEAIFDLADPAKRDAALQRVKAPATRAADHDAELFSAQADEIARGTDGTDLQSMERMLADEQAITDEMAAQAGVDLAPFTKEADELMSEAQSYAAAYRAAAICQLRN